MSLMPLVKLIPRRYLAAQLRRPSGLLGRLVIAPALNRGNARENEAVREALRLGPEDRVLEVGFGGGGLIAIMLPALPRGHVSGADFSAEMVAYCARRFAAPIVGGAIDLVQAEVESLPFPSGSFDKACTANTIYFWAAPERAAAELFRVLKPGGRLVVGYSPRSAIIDLPTTRYGFTVYDQEDVEQLLRAAGFASIETLESGGRHGEFLCATGLRP
jgi:arsenite methyltransferase